MTDEKMTESIDIIYQKLIDECQRSTARNQLAVLKGALDSQIKSGRDDFSISSLARIMEPEGGPKESTLRNKNGERYRVLIAAYKARHTNPVSKHKQSKNPDWVDKIEALDIRWLVKDLISGNKALRAENNALRSVKKLNIDMTTISEVPLQNKELPNLNEMEIDTLKHFISPEHLRSVELSFDEKGRLFDTKSNEILSGRHLRKAIEKVLTVRSL
jgi:hypothetical protein